MNRRTHTHRPLVKERAREAAPAQDREAAGQAAAPEESAAPAKLARSAAATAAVIACLVLGLASAAQAAPADLDPSFSGDGKEVTDFGGNDMASSIALQPDGKIVAVGQNGADFALARHNPDGSLDVSFSGDGKQTTDFGGTFDKASGVALQANDAEIGEAEWVRQFGGAGGPANEIAHGVAPDGSGHVYVVGETNGSQVDPSTGEETVNQGLLDPVVRKYSAADGTLIWARQPGTAFNDQAFAVATDGAGGVYVAGRTQGSYPSFTNAGGFDAVIWKYDANGTLLWTRQLPGAKDGVHGTTDDVVNALAADASGAYLVGTTASNLFPEPESVNDAFAAKCASATGAVLWGHQFGTDGLDTGRGVSVDASGVYVAGESHGILFDTGDAHGASPDVFIRKYTLAGVHIWGDQFGTVGVDVANAVHSDGTGVYLAGTTNGGLFGHANAGGSDIILAKYSATATDADRRWFTQLGSGTGGTAENDRALAIFSDGIEAHATGGTGGALFGTHHGLEDVFRLSFAATGDAFAETSSEQLGSVANDVARAVAADSTGVYIAGDTFGAVLGQTSKGADDGFVHKEPKPASGSAAWTDQFGDPTGPAVDTATAVAPGSAFVVGQTNGLLGTSSFGSTDAFVTKYEDDGRAGWTPAVTQLGSVLGDIASAVAVDPSGDIYVAGSANEQIDPAVPKVGNQDGFVRKYTGRGTVRWTRQFGTAASDVVNGAAADASGVWLVGQTQSAGGGDVIVRKYDPDGILVPAWTKIFGSPFEATQAGLDEAFAVALHAARTTTSVYVAGWTRHGIVFQTTGVRDAFVRRYDGAGNELWTRQIASVDNLLERAAAVAADGSGVYVAGLTQGSLPGFTFAGGVRDAFIRKYAPDGTHLWTHQFGTGGDDRIMALAVDESGVYAVGDVGGALPGQASEGLMDAFIRKYDPAGNVIWTLQLGTAATDEGLGVAVGSSGLYITGSTQGVLGPSGAGGQDAYVAKVAQISIVAIDIEPGSFPNAIDLDSQDVVPVAILSGPTFDATTVDPATVTLVCPAVEMESKSAGAASVEDVNGDSLPDIVVPVRTEALELSATDEDAQLDARTFDGRPIRGTDLVRVVAP